VIGTPKMDEWVAEQFPAPAPSGIPVLAIAFHWGERGARPPESGSAWEHYREILPELARRYQVIGHGHPLSAHVYRRHFERMEIEWVPDFREVLRRADLYLNDLSSTMYEFVVTGKPVVVLNAPWFRRKVHWGIRFWDYADVGLQVEGPEGIFDAIDETLANYETVCLDERRQAVADLYPYLGHSAARGVEVLTSVLEAA
jgi:CDP-glycerol glycerophosphotransferase (TagB/SpsB family)